MHGETVKNLFEYSNYFHVPIHWRVQVMYFFWGGATPPICETAKNEPTKGEGRVYKYVC
jgi:hypothetical protein